MRFFFAFGALYYILSVLAKNTFGGEKKGCALKKIGVDANEETLERGRRKASRVPRRVMPLFAQLFSVVVVVVVLAYVWSVFARFCVVVVCVNVQHKNNVKKREEEEEESFVMCFGHLLLGQKTKESR